MYAPRAIREVCLVFAAVTAASVALVRIGAALAMPSLAPLGVAVVFLSTALGMADRRGGAERFGITLGGLLAARPVDEPASEGDFPNRVMTSLRSAMRETGVALSVAALT